MRVVRRAAKEPVPSPRRRYNAPGFFMLLSTGARLGPYEILSAIGAGYVAVGISLNRPAQRNVLLSISVHRGITVCRYTQRCAR